MKIAIEINWGNKAGGARRVAINTLLEMIKIKPSYEYTVFSNCLQKQLNNTNIDQKILRPKIFMPQIIFDQFIFTHISVPSEIKKIKPNIVHFTNHMVSFRGNTPSVVTIHDLAPFIMPKSFLYAHTIYQKLYFKHATKKAKRIIAVSENTKKDLCEILNVNEKKITVVHNAALIKTKKSLEGSQDKELYKNIIKDNKYILYVGAIHPRKNVGGLIKAFHHLEIYKKIPHKLVIAGEFRWKLKQSLPRNIIDKTKNNIIFPGRISDDVLISLYKNCSAFVYPSFYEGFGLPVLEAMSYGAPVITSNVSSLPEVAGDAAILIDPYNYESIAEGIWSIIDNDNLANSLRKKGENRAKQFSWEKTARKTLEVYESLF